MRPKGEGDIRVFVACRGMSELFSAVLDACAGQPCLQGGVCIRAVDPHAPAGFVCQCPPCFSGVRCETRVCEEGASTGVLVLRAVLLGSTALLGLFAAAMFVYRVSVVARERETGVPTRVKGTPLEAARVTRFRGQDSLVLRSKCAASQSLCGSIVSAVQSSSTRRATAPRPDLARGLALWQERHRVQTNAAPARPRRFPPWDEVEMRRHGLVDRHCVRVYQPDCPTDPSSVPVSVVQAAPDTATIQLDLPPDSSGSGTPVVAPATSASRTSVSAVGSVYADPSLSAHAGKPVRSGKP